MNKNKAILCLLYPKIRYHYQPLKTYIEAGASIGSANECMIGLNRRVNSFSSISSSVEYSPIKGGFKVRTSYRRRVNNKGGFLVGSISTNNLNVID